MQKTILKLLKISQTEFIQWTVKICNKNVFDFYKFLKAVHIIIA